MLSWHTHQPGPAIKGKEGSQRKKAKEKERGKREEGKNGLGGEWWGGVGLGRREGGFSLM